MKPISEIVKNLNLIRLSGAKDFIMLELTGSICKLVQIKLTEPFYQLKNNEIFNDIKIISSKAFNWGNDDAKISDELNNFVKDSGSGSPVLLIGINEYKFTTVSIPSHIESEAGEEDIWFAENYSSFLPDESYLDSFIFSYEKIIEDENYKTFSVVVVRKDYLVNILKYMKNIKIVGIYPFITAVSSLKYLSKNVLLIDFTVNKISYSFYDTEAKFFSGELFTSIYDDQFNLINRKLNTEELVNALAEIKNFLNSSLSNQLSEKLNLFICCQKTDVQTIEKYAIGIFNEATKINEVFPETDPFIIPSQVALNKFINNFDTGLSLLEAGKITEVRNSFEKKAGLRITLSLGVVLLSLLFISYMSDIVLSYKTGANENILVQVKANKIQIENLEKQNSLIKKSLSYLGDLKNNKSGYSKLLSDLSEVVNTNCRFTNIDINESDPQVIQITLNGISRAQNDIAEFISALEKNEQYRNITLANIAAGNKKEYYEFRLTAEYDVERE